jgi:hypothetical protein
MPEIRPRLQILGAFGIQRALALGAIVVKMSLRRRVRVRVDDPRGVLSWSLSYKKLPGTLDGAVTLTGDEWEGSVPGDVVSQADYLWQFFCARKSGERESFLITDLHDGRRRSYLVVFDTEVLTYTLFMTRLFSSEGVPLAQVDEDDVPTLDDGSVGEPDGGVLNPQQV